MPFEGSAIRRALSNLPPDCNIDDGTAKNGAAAGTTTIITNSVVVELSSTSINAGRFEPLLLIEKFPDGYQID